MSQLQKNQQEYKKLRQQIIESFSGNMTVDSANEQIRQMAGINNDDSVEAKYQKMESRMSGQMNVDVAIIGAGTAGLYALREVRRAKKSFVLIDTGPLGTTCARVGCMPSKVALHIGEYWHAQKDFPRYGISGAEHLRLDTQQAWAELRRQRDNFAGGAAAGAERAAGEQLIMRRISSVPPSMFDHWSLPPNCMLQP